MEACETTEGRRGVACSLVIFEVAVVGSVGASSRHCGRSDDDDSNDEAADALREGASSLVGDGASGMADNEECATTGRVLMGIDDMTGMDADTVAGVL